LSGWLASLDPRLPELGREFGSALLYAAIGVAVALVVHSLLYGLLKRLATASESKVDDVVVRSLRGPTRYATIALGLALAARESALLAEVWQKLAGFLMPALVGWIALASLNAFVKASAFGADAEPAGSKAARRRRTRLAIFARIGAFLIVFVTVGLMLLSIPGVRDIGLTLMASAGLAGLAVGAAAQPALKSLIAGLQMALTEPINIGDLVTVDGHSGRVEDIKTTYVVLHTWDERHVIVPTAKFLESTFENATRDRSELVGTVVLHLDPLAEIAPLRAAFERQVAAHPAWDKRSASVRVTDAAAGSIEVRLAMSARDPGALFELRCAIRESMLAWIREHQPRAIAYQRTDEADEA
jgi:small-conductance mechanosensitive channel